MLPKDLSGFLGEFGIGNGSGGKCCAHVSVSL
jgi:hypothetical protein